MDTQVFSQLMQTRGWIKMDGLVSPDLLQRMPDDLDRAYERRREIQVRNEIGGSTQGTSHHLVGEPGSLHEFLEGKYLLREVSAALGGKCILNSYGAVTNLPGASAYVGAVHRDIRSYLSGEPLMLNMLVMLDEFTEENGATYILSGSHHIAEKPSDELFFEHAERLTGPPGTIAVWDSRVWHAAGVNRSERPRRGLTLVFSRPFIKQGLDYTRAISPEIAVGLDEDLRQLLGFYSRVPANLDEWYQPPAGRFYRSDQG